MQIRFKWNINRDLCKINHIQRLRKSASIKSLAKIPVLFLLISKPKMNEFSAAVVKNQQLTIMVPISPWVRRNNLEDYGVIFYWSIPLTLKSLAISKNSVLALRHGLNFSFPHTRERISLPPYLHDVCSRDYSFT